MPSGWSHAAGTGPSDSANAASATTAYSPTADCETPSTRRRTAAQRPTPASRSTAAPGKTPRSEEPSAQSSHGRRLPQTLRYERTSASCTLDHLQPVREPHVGLDPVVDRQHRREQGGEHQRRGRELAERRPAQARATRHRGVQHDDGNRQRQENAEIGVAQRLHRPAHAPEAASAFARRVSRKRCSSARASTSNRRSASGDGRSGSTPGTGCRRKGFLPPRRRRPCW